MTLSIRRQTKSNARAKRNLHDNDVLLFQFLGFYVLALNNKGFRRDPRLPFSFCFGFVVLYGYNEEI